MARDMYTIKFLLDEAKELAANIQFDRAVGKFGSQPYWVTSHWQCTSTNYRRLEVALFQLPQGNTIA